MPARTIRPGGFLSLLAVLLLGLAACDDDSPTDPIAVPEENLEFVTLRSLAPPLETVDTVLWAVPGEDRELEIRYLTTSDRFLRIRIDAATLLRLNGVPVADSVMIRVVVNDSTFAADFTPNGLDFLQEPAELEIRYDLAEDEFLKREQQFDIWRQERPDDPWVLLQSFRIGDFRIKADLDGFTRYALAIGR